MEHARAKYVVSARRACRVVRQWRGTQRYQPLRRTDEEELTQAILALATKYGRYGDRRITGLRQNAGWRVGHDRVQRIWRREGLKVPQKPPILSAIGFHQLCVNAYFTFRYIAPRILFLKMGTGESFGQPDAAQQVGKAAIGAEAVQFGVKRRGRNRTATSANRSRKRHRTELFPKSREAASPRVVHRSPGSLFKRQFRR